MNLEAECAVDLPVDRFDLSGELVRPRRTAGSHLAIALAVILVAGCESSPTAPSSQGGSPAPVLTGSNPAGLASGQQYRLVFVTSGTRDATSTSIAAYNAFVAGFGARVIPNHDWRAIASTAAVSARDNTGTNPLSDGAGVAIYAVDGTLVATGNAGLWSGALANDITMTETLGPVAPSFPQFGLPDTFVWTGTAPDGSSAPGGVSLFTDEMMHAGGPLGDPDGWSRGGAVNCGCPPSAWVSLTTEPSGDFSLPLYAMSQVLTVP